LHDAVQAVGPQAYNVEMDLDVPLRTAEFLVVDTETNGKAGEDCEVTEVGAVLVGGGELHDRWETLLSVHAPLGRGIQRFTGISQGMVDEAPAAEAMLPELAELMKGRVLVAHSASFDRRVLRQAFERGGVEWPDPPVLCTVAMARRLAPLVRQRRLAPLAESLGIEVGVTHRALADAETCARVFCALFGRLCAGAGTVGDAIGVLRATRPRRARAGATDGGRSLRGVRRRAPDLRGVPDEPGVYIFRNAAGQPLYVGKSVALRSRARAHFAASSPDTDWVSQVEVVDHRVTRSELGALLLEHRLIRELRPPGNVRHKHVDGYVYLRCRLDISFPVLEVAPEPAPGLAVNIGPLRGRTAVVELMEQLNSLFSLRHCGRALPRRDWPSAYGQMGRCMSPCLHDLDPNAYRRRLDEALASVTSAPALLAHVDAEMRTASADQRFERAAWLRRRRARLAVLLERVGDLVDAARARPRLVLAEHPRGGRFDAVWLAGGRVATWDALDEVEDVGARTSTALGRTAGPGLIHLTPDEVAEARIVATWCAANEPPTLALGPDARGVAEFVAAVCGSGERQLDDARGNRAVADAELVAR
jgi:DNA polymerase-3 subunit epsilon